MRTSRSVRGPASFILELLIWIYLATLDLGMIRKARACVILVRRIELGV